MKRGREDGRNVETGFEPHFLTPPPPPSPLELHCDLSCEMIGNLVPSALFLPQEKGLWERD